jgi:integrase
MVSHQTLMISRQPIKHPVSGSDMGIVIGAVHTFRSFLVPTRPCTPVDVAAIEIRRHLIGLIVEETLLHSVLDRAGKAAGVGHLGTHTFRHSYRMWIDAVGTPIGVQQKLMRHSDIRTTMNIYGDAASTDMRNAHEKVVRLALRT